MRITVKENITRFKTIEVSERYEDMDKDEFENCCELRDDIWSVIDVLGWDHEYSHEFTIEEGVHEPTIFYKG